MSIQMEAGAIKGLQGWSVAGADRLVGVGYTAEGQTDGRTIITSRVVRVRFEGVPPLPVAITASGTEYWLGAPSAKFKMETPEQFVSRKVIEENHSEPDARDSDSVTRYTAPGGDPER